MVRGSNKSSTCISKHQSVKEKAREEERNNPKHERMALEWRKKGRKIKKLKINYMKNNCFL